MVTPADLDRLTGWIAAGLQPGTGPEPTVLIRLFDELPSVPEAAMIGEWQGGAFGSDHPTEYEMQRIRWAGKTIRSRDDVDPIVCVDDDGRRFASDVMGGAVIREVVWNGVASAAMIYDRQPVIDYFRRIDTDTLLGLMTRKGWDMPLPFWLRRLQRPQDTQNDIIESPQINPD